MAMFYQRVILKVCQVNGYMDGLYISPNGLPLAVSGGLNALTFH